MEQIESEGKTLSEAVESALRKLGLRRDQVEVQIIQEASAGFLGMGAKPARVRLSGKLWGEPASPSGEPATQPPAPRRPIGSTSRPEPAPPRAAVDPAKACGEAAAVLNDLLRLMGLALQKPEVSWDNVQERVRCSLQGADAAPLTAGGGQTLEALQFLVTLMVSRRAASPVAVQVDAMGYWDKREKAILAQAEKGVCEVRSTGRPFRLPPMDAPMRRLIHRSLTGHSEVETASEGEGSWRKIVIRPRKR